MKYFCPLQVISHSHFESKVILNRFFFKMKFKKFLLIFVIFNIILAVNGKCISLGFHLNLSFHLHVCKHGKQNKLKDRHRNRQRDKETNHTQRRKSSRLIVKLCQYICIHLFTHLKMIARSLNNLTC